MLLTLLSLLAIPVGYYLLIELKGFLRIRRYKRQGIKMAEHQTLPAAYSKGKASGLSEPLAESKRKMKEQDPDQPFWVTNFGSTCLVTLVSEKAINEFYAKETEVCVKPNPLKKRTNLRFFGFLLDNGKEVQKKRAVFAKIFHYSNVLNLMAGIRKVIRQHVAKLKKWAEAEGGRLKIDLREKFSRALLDDLTACILLGGTENKLVDRFDGMTVTEVIQKMVMVFNAYARNPLKIIPFSSKLELVKEEKELRRLQKGLTNIVRKEYNKRYNQKDLSEESVIDIMVKLNKESEKEAGKPKFSVEEISSNFELFHFAASDTSFHLSSSTLAYLALPENEKYQKRIQAEIDSELGASDSYSNEKLNSLEELNRVFRETTRIANPATSITRIVTKDFKLEGYTVYKGDVLTNPLLNFEPGLYKDPLEFNPDRFNTHNPNFKKAPKLKQIPFSHGQRGCLGKYLGEMMVKLIVVELLKEFEVSVEPGYVMKFGFVPVFTVTNPDLVLEVRRGQ